MIGKIGILEKVYFECIGIVENVMLVGKVFICYKFYGVVVVFGFYNFLGYLFNGYIVLVLIVGNIIVFKFSDLILVVVEVMVKLWEQVGLFKGVLNLVQGEVEIGKVLVSYYQLDGLFFIGSLCMGKILYE